MKPVSAAFLLAFLALYSIYPTFALPDNHQVIFGKGDAPAGASAGGGAFAFVSNFESFTLEGWQRVSGASPTVVSAPNYFGEPSLSSAAGSGPQVDTASQGFVLADSFISFQVAMNSQGGAGYFGLSGPGGPVAVVGISGGRVYAGTSPSSAVAIEDVPSGTAYPAGWVYLTANVYDASTKPNSRGGWTMQLFVDRTDVVAATISVPSAGGYSAAMIETTAGVAYYTDIVVSTTSIPRYVPGYNNMDGYGQGSGSYISLLPAYYNLTARMRLNSWSTPQVGILSFQINAMNQYGSVSTAHSCVGFFQLGVDLNPNGMIAPWYVPGRNCVAHYFLSSQKPAIQSGVPSPQGTDLILSIVQNPAAKQVIFTIKDLSTSQVFVDSRPYNGTPFFSSYTQLEFQPCCNSFPIQDYKVNGSIYDMQVTTQTGSVQRLPASYMIPFALDSPPSWSLTYYLGGTAGYAQVSK